MLADCQQRRNIVAGMRIVRRQEGVVKIQFTNGNAVGPGRPFRRNALRTAQAKHRCTWLIGMRFGLRSRACNGMPRQRGGSDRGIVDNAVADHVGDVGLDGHGVGGHFSDLPGQLIGAGEPIGGFEGFYMVLLQDPASSLIPCFPWVVVCLVIGTGRPNSFTATISNVPRTADLRRPLTGSSRIISTATVIELRPTRATVAMSSTSSPTRIGS